MKSGCSFLEIPYSATIIDTSLKNATLVVASLKSLTVLQSQLPPKTDLV